jgi:hypothetical protein
MSGVAGIVRVSVIRGIAMVQPASCSFARPVYDAVCMLTAVRRLTMDNPADMTALQTKSEDK